MSALQSQAQSSQTLQKADSYSISKYNFKTEHLEKNVFRKYYQDSDTIVKKYYTEKETYETTIFTYENTITVQDVIKDNSIILLNSNAPLLTTSASGDAAADDKDRGKRTLSQLQKNILTSIRQPKEYNPYLAEQQVQKSSLQLHKNVEIYKQNIIRKKRLQEQERSFSAMMYKITTSPMVTMITPFLVGIGFNLLVVHSITNPTTWILCLPNLISLQDVAGKLVFTKKANILFQGFLDLFYTAGFFTMNDIGNLKKLYNEAEVYCSQSTTNSTPEAIQKIVEDVFHATTTEQDLSYEDNKLYNFFKYVFVCIKKKDILHPEPQSNLKISDIFANKEWFQLAISISNSTQGQFLLSSLRLTSNIFSYVSTSMELFSKYEGINKMIIFEKGFKYITTTRTFYEITRYMSTSTLEGSEVFLQWLQKNLPQGSTFVGYVKESGLDYILPEEPPFVREKRNEAMEYIRNKLPEKKTDIDVLGFIKENMPNFFTISFDSILQFTITYGPNAYFTSLKRESEKNIKRLVETESEQIKKIEEQVIEISKYKTQNYTNEQIVELLNPTPDEPNQYRLTILRYIVDFKNKFKKYVKNPGLAFQNITIYSHGWTIVEFLTKNMHFAVYSVAVTAMSRWVLQGYDAFNVRELFPFSLIKLFLPEGTIIDFITYYTKIYYGDNAAITARIDLYKAGLIADIVHDLQQFHTDVQNLFFDSQIGMSISKYFSQINRMWAVKAIHISIKIMYFISKPLLGAAIQPVLYPALDVLKLDIYSILEDRQKLINFTVFTNHKLSNVFRAIKTWDLDKVVDELKQFQDINKILFNTVLPYLTANGYYELYDRQSENNIKGQLINLPDPDENVTDINEYFITDVKDIQDDKEYTLCSPGALFQQLRQPNLIGPNRPGTIMDISGVNLYDVFYAYYKKEFEGKKNADPPMSGNFDDYVKNMYYSLYRKVYQLPEFYLKKEVEEEKKEERKEEAVIPLPTRHEIVELGILQGVLKIHEDKRIEKEVNPSSGVFGFFYARVQNINDAILYIRSLFGTSGAPSGSAAPTPPYRLHPDLVMKNVQEFVLIQEFLQGKKNDMIDISEVKKSQKAMIPLNPTFDLSLPNSFGFRFQTVEMIDFYDMMTLMKYVLTEEELKDPEEILLKIQPFSEKDSEIASQMGALNFDFNRQFLTIVKGIKQFSKLIKGRTSDITDENYKGKGGFSDWKKTTLPLSDLDFDYHAFKEECIALLKKKKDYFEERNRNVSYDLIVRDEDQAELFAYLKSLLSFDKMCKQPGGTIVFVDEDDYNMITNVKENCDTEIRFPTADNKENISILMTLLLRPDIIQRIKSVYSIYKEEVESYIPVPASTQAPTITLSQPPAPVPAPAPAPVPVPVPAPVPKQTPKIITIEQKKAIVELYESNTFVIDTVHESMIDMVTTILKNTINSGLDETDEREKKIQDLQAEVDELTKKYEAVQGVITELTDVTYIPNLKTQILLLVTNEGKLRSILSLQSQIEQMKQHMSVINKNSAKIDELNQLFSSEEPKLYQEYAILDTKLINLGYSVLRDENGKIVTRDKFGNFKRKDRNGNIYYFDKSIDNWLNEKTKESIKDPIVKQALLDSTIPLKKVDEIPGRIDTIKKELGLSTANISQKNGLPFYDKQADLVTYSANIKILEDQILDIISKMTNFKSKIVLRDKTKIKDTLNAIEAEHAKLQATVDRIESYSEQEKEDLIKTNREELGKMSHVLTEKENQLIQYDKYRLVGSFLFIMKKLNRIIAMDDSVKKTVYDYFDVAEKDVMIENNIDFSYFRREKQNQIDEIDRVCNLPDSKEKRDKILSIYTDNVFSNIVNLTRISYDANKNFGVVAGSRHFSYQPLNFLKRQFDGFLSENDEFNKRRGQFEQNVSQFACPTSDIEEIKQYITLKFDLFEEIRKKRALNYYDTQKRNIDKYERTITTSLFQFNTRMQTILVEAELRERNRQSTIPDVLNVGGATPTDVTATTDSSPTDTPVVVGPSTRVEGPGLLEPTVSDSSVIGNINEQSQQESQQESQGETQQQQIDQATKQAESEALKQSEKEAQDTSLQQKEAVKEESSLKNMLTSLFGDDGWISNMTSMLSNLTGTKLTTKDVSLQNVESFEQELDQELTYEDNLRWCKDHSHMWYMSGNELVLNKLGSSAMSEGRIKKEQFNKCKQDSLFYSFSRIVFTGIMTLLSILGWGIEIAYETIVATLTAIAWILFYIPGAQPIAMYLFYIVSIMKTPSVESVLKGMTVCMDMWFLYFSVIAMEGFAGQTDKVGVTVIQVGYLFGLEYIKEREDKPSKVTGALSDTEYNSKKLACGEALRALSGLSTISSLTDDTKTRILVNLGLDASGNRPDYYKDAENNNYYMKINTGLLEPESNRYESDPAFFAEVLLEIYGEPSQQSQATKDKLKQLSLIQFARDCSVYDHYTINDGLMAQLDPKNVYHSILPNMIYCKLFDEPPPEESDLYTVSWWISFITKLTGFLTNDKVITVVLKPILAFILPKKKLTQYLLTRFFGNSSYKPHELNIQNNDTQVNINVVRDVMNTSLKNLMKKSTNADGTIDDNKLQKHIKSDITDVFGLFFASIYNHFFSYLLSFGGTHIPAFTFDAFKYFDQECALNTCNQQRMKELIRKAICEMLYVSPTQKMRNILLPPKMKIEDLFVEDDPNTFCDKDVFNSKYENDDEGFNILIATIQKNMQTINKTPDIWKTFKIDPIESSSKIDSKDKKTTQEDYIARYFNKFRRMITIYQAKKIPTLDEEKYREFLKSSINDGVHPNPYIYYRLNMVNKVIQDRYKSKDFTGRNTPFDLGKLASGIDIDTAMPELYVTPCDGQSRIIMLPGDGIDPLSKKYTCVAILGENVDFDTLFRDGVEKVKSRNQIQIIQQLIQEITRSRNKRIQDTYLRNRGEIDDSIQKINNILTTQVQLTDTTMIDKSEIHELPNLLQNILLLINEPTMRPQDNVAFKKLDMSQLITQIEEKVIKNAIVKIEQSIELSSSELMATNPYVYVFAKINGTIEEETDKNKSSDVSTYIRGLQEINSYYSAILNHKGKGVDDRGNVDAIKSTFSELIIKLRADSRFTIDPSLSDLVSTITYENIIAPVFAPTLPNNADVYFIQQELTAPAIQDDHARKEYIEEILSDKAVSRVDMEYFIYVYSKFILDNSDDFYTDSLKIIQLLQRKKGTVGYTYSKEDIDLLIPLQEENKYYQSIKENIIDGQLENPAFVNGMIDVLLSKQKGPVVPERFIKANSGPRNFIGNDLSGNKIDVRNPYDFILYPDKIDPTFEYQIQNAKNYMRTPDPMQYFITFLHSNYGKAVTTTSHGRVVLTNTISHSNIAKDFEPFTSGGATDESNNNLLKNIQKKDSRFTIFTDAYETYINNIFSDMTAKKKQISYDGSRVAYLDYDNFLRGGNFDPDITSGISSVPKEIGLPPILFDPHCNIMNIKKSDFFTINLDVDYYKQLVALNYQEIHTQTTSGTPACIWLLKMDIAYLSSIFDNFDTEEYAKQISDTMEEQDKILAFITPELIQKNETPSTFFGYFSASNTLPGILKTHIRNRGTEINYFSTLPIKGISLPSQDQEAGTSFSDLKHLYYEKGYPVINDADGSEKRIKMRKGDWDKFLNVLVPMSLLYANKGGQQGGGGLIRDISETSDPTKINFEIRDTVEDTSKFIQSNIVP